MPAALRLRISSATGVRWAQRIRRGGEASLAVMGRPVGHGKLAPYTDFFKNSSHRIPISPFLSYGMPWLTITEKRCIILVSQSCLNVWDIRIKKSLVASELN